MTSWGWRGFGAGWAGARAVGFAFCGLLPIVGAWAFDPRSGRSVKDGARPSDCGAEVPHQ